jgi:hypothetical protein
MEGRDLGSLSWLRFGARSVRVWIILLGMEGEHVSVWRVFLRGVLRLIVVTPPVVVGELLGELLRRMIARAAPIGAW